MHEYKYSRLVFLFFFFCFVRSIYRHRGVVGQNAVPLSEQAVRPELQEQMQPDVSREQRVRRKPEVQMSILFQDFQSIFEFETTFDNRTQIHRRLARRIRRHGCRQIKLTRTLYTYANFIIYPTYVYTRFRRL